ncbi:MAG: putative Ig domain-containing protein [Verrucomicrobia bacterium]|nr:putative Ig domain-containing protein [Verrucomicrobiota bacterium]
MPAPILSPTTSILALTRGRFYSIQPALAPGSSPATSWSLISGGFPDGMTLNPVTGRISGTPSRESEGSVFVAMVTANNASGPSAPLKLVFGIEHARVEPDGSLEAFLDLSTSGIGFRGHDKTDDFGRAVVHVKRGDRFPLSVTFLKGTEVIDLAVTNLAIVLKEFEPESRILLNPSGHLEKQGIEDTARWITYVEFSDPAIATMLGNYEDDSDTAFPALAEVEVSYQVDRGPGLSPFPAVRTSATFVFMVHRDLVR